MEKIEIDLNIWIFYLLFCQFLEDDGIVLELCDEDLLYFEFEGPLRIPLDSYFLTFTPEVLNPS